MPEKKPGLTQAQRSGDGAVPVFSEPAPPPDPELLTAMFGMQPEQAVAFLRENGLAVTDHWAEMLDEAHARAFTVARCAQLDVLRDIRTSLLASMKEGKPFEQFKKKLMPLLQAKGWWGTKTVIGADGKEKTVQLGNPRRLKTIYQTNLQSAYMSQRMEMQMADDYIKYLQYIAVMDGRTRPAHRALNGRVYRKDDSIWASIYPPNGFGCRCRVEGLSEREVARDGVNVHDSAGDKVTRDAEIGPSATTGEVFPTQQVGVRVTLENGQPGIMWTDPGFNSSPITSSIFDRQLIDKAEKALQDGPKAYALAKNTVMSETRLRAWRNFVDNARRSPTGEQQGRTMTAGILPYAIASEAGFSPVLEVRDGLIVGQKGKRHTSMENALSDDEWKRLPLLLDTAEYYLPTERGIEQMNRNILILAEEKEGKAIKIAVKPDGAVATAFWWNTRSLPGWLKGGLYRAVKP